MNELVNGLYFSISLSQWFVYSFFGSAVLNLTRFVFNEKIYLFLVHGVNFISGVVGLFVPVRIVVFDPNLCQFAAWFMLFLIFEPYNFYCFVGVSGVVFCVNLISLIVPRMKYNVFKFLLFKTEEHEIKQVKNVMLQDGIVDSSDFSYKLVLNRFFDVNKYRLEQFIQIDLRVLLCGLLMPLFSNLEPTGLFQFYQVFTFLISLIGLIICQLAISKGNTYIKLYCYCAFICACLAINQNNIPLITDLYPYFLGAALLFSIVIISKNKQQNAFSYIISSLISIIFFQFDSFVYQGIIIIVILQDLVRPQISQINKPIQSK